MLFNPMMNSIKNVALKYFEPKSLEYYKEGHVYILIGIKYYKRYLPSSGDVMRKWRKITQIKPTESNKVEELIKYERRTRNFEWRHLLGIIILIVLSITIERKFTLFDWLFVFLLNLIVNIYPIFLQRYNRIRIIAVLKRNGYKTPYDRT